MGVETAVAAGAKGAAEAGGAAKGAAEAGGAAKGAGEAAGGGAAKGAAETAAGALGAESALAPVGFGGPLDLAAIGGLPEVGSTGLGGIMSSTASAAGTGIALEPGLAAGFTSETLGGMSGLPASGFPGGSAGLGGGIPGGGVGQSGALDNVAMGLSPNGTPVGTTTGPTSLGGVPTTSPVSASGAGAPGGVTPAIAADPTAALAGQPMSLGQAAAAPAAPGAAAPGGIEGIINSAGKSIMANPLGTALAAGGLGYNMLAGNQTGPNQEAMMKQAASLNAQGQQLASYLQSGTLPPGLQKSVDQATNAAKARAISNFAAQGMPTDPTKNSALASQLAMIDQAAIVSIAQIGQQLMATGMSASGLSSQLYTTLAGFDQTQTANIGKAIGNMATALSPNKGLTFQFGK